MLGHFLSRQRLGLAALGLSILVAAAFGRALPFPFVYDDSTYITRNHDLLGGASVRAAAWALTTFHAANWHPLTWASHLLDITLFGLHPAGHRLVSLLLQAANASLLLLLLVRLTGSFGRSLAVAAIFAVHPLRVESVVWVAERKDLLAGFFFMLTLLAWLRHLRGPSPRRYAVALGCFALGLLAKPMLVTLPFVLLLLDAWPLARIVHSSAASERRSSADFSSVGLLNRVLITAQPSVGKVAIQAPLSRLATNRCEICGLAREKLPFLALAVLSSIVTFVAQSRGGVVGGLDRYPLAARLMNAAGSYTAYLRRTVWPADLAVFYPWPDYQPLMRHTLLGVALLAAITVAAVILRRQRPSLSVGWLWFLGMLVPVIGLVQVGNQALADRYSYLPQVGLLCAIVWALPAPLTRARRLGAAGLTAAIVLALGIATFAQTGYWRDEVTLFARAEAVSPGNATVRHLLAFALAEADRPREAHGYFSPRLTGNPAIAMQHLDQGIALYNEGRLDEAASHFRIALGLNPDYIKARAQLGRILAMQGKPREAEAQYREALRLDPSLWEVEAALANLRTQSDGPIVREGKGR